MTEMFESFTAARMQALAIDQAVLNAVVAEGMGEFVIDEDWLQECEVEKRRQVQLAIAAYPHAMAELIQRQSECAAVLGEPVPAVRRSWWSRVRAWWNGG